MIENQKSSTGLKAVIGLCAFAISAGLQIASGNAQTPIPAKYPDKPYFVEFRARSALSYGHTFLVHGRVGQRITKNDVVGLHPFTESSVPWSIGHIIPVPSETGASDGDYEDEYIIARYRVYLSAAEYKPILAKMREWQGSTPLWHAVVYNCNAFVGSVARYMGLEAPNPLVGQLQLPKDFIEDLKAVNGGRDVLSGSQATVAAASSNRQQVSGAAAGRARSQTAAAAPNRGRPPDGSLPVQQAAPGGLRQDASAALVHARPSRD